MTPKKLTETKIVIGPCRLSYPNLFERKKFDGDTGEGKYMVTVLIPKSADGKDTVEAIRECIEAAKTAGASSKWQGKTPKKLSLPLVDGDESDDEYIQGHYTIKAKSNMRPTVLDRKRQPIVDQEEIYGGVWAYVSISFFPYDAAGNKGVAVALNSVMKFKDDDPFGGSDSALDFDGIEFDAEDDDDL